MPWVITVHVTACAGGANIGGAFVTDGQSTGYTDSYGDFTAVIYDDVDPAYGVNIGKAGYVTRYDVLYQTQAGTTQQVCLDVAPPPSTGGGGTTHCFIVSATTGSPESAENMRLNMLRDRVLAATDIGSTLLEAIYRDYYSFSPPIAKELAADPELRDQVLRVGVRPLLAWYGLIEVLVLDRDSHNATAKAADEVLAACRPDLPFTTESTARLLARICRGDRVSRDTLQPFAYLASRLQDAVTLPFSAWAIFTPLVLAWECAATGANVIERASTWLSEAPLEQLSAPVPGERLEGELAQLAGGPFASPRLRRYVGTRLIDQWPHLDDELRRHGFISDDSAAPV